MTPIAIAFLILAIVLVWGSLAAAIISLIRHPEVSSYPEGGQDTPAHIGSVS